MPMRDGLARICWQPPCAPMVRVGRGSGARGRAIDLAATLGVALHELRDGGARLLPLRLVAEDDAVAAPARDLCHRRDDEVVGQLPVAARVQLPRDEVAPDRLVRRGPLAPAELVALAERLEPLVVADRVPVVLDHVLAQV